MSEKIKQTAGRDQLGEFAPMFAHLNDDVLFGEVWHEEAISVKTKCIITVVSLMASGITDSSLVYHLQNAKNNGVTREEIAAIITHATMYVGWPKGWAVFRLAKDVWNEETPALSDKDRFQKEIFFPIGEENPYGQYFVGQSYLAPLSSEQVPMFNVTFEPSCRNNWHIHHATQGGGQMLVCIGGQGWYQQGSGRPARRLHRQYPAERQALARRGKGQLVCSLSAGDCGRERLYRMVRSGIRRRLSQLGVIATSL